MDSDLLQALIAGAVWLGILIVVRWSLRRAFDRYEARLAERDAAVAARRRTTFSFLLRIVIALVALIGIWSVLSKFPATQQIASAFLASSAVLAVIAGLALTTPLGNLGSGLLLAFTQPVRLGDRVTIDEHTGIVDEITLSYTALTTDEGQSWEAISPDLTKADPETLKPTGGPVNKDAIGAETYATVFAFCESPHEAGVLSMARTNDPNSAGSQFFLCLGRHPHLIPHELVRDGRIPLAGVAHQNGTVRFGDDPRTSALDRDCKAWDLDNLYVVDTSFFPSSAAVNPALTAMANALRVGDHLLERMDVSLAVMDARDRTEAVA